MRPEVSVIIPCRNEEKTIPLVLDALAKQTFSLERVEVVIADGFSTDKTRQAIQDFQNQHKELSIQVVDNPEKAIPCGLNAAIRASQGKLILRMDGHSIPRPDYIERCVAALAAEKAENVGGVWDITPQNDSWIAKSIALAASNPLAVGDALYRFSSTPAYVDTVPFGAFRRELFDRIGWFDETLLTNEDYELNTRIRLSGGRVWLDPQIRCTYFARKNLAELANQYWRYGFWKAQMIRRYPHTLRPRQALPPLFVFGLAVLLLIGLFVPLFRWFFLAILGVYGLVLLGTGLSTAIKKHDFRLIAGIPLAIATMHFSWGAGFIAGTASRQKTSAPVGEN